METRRSNGPTCTITNKISYTKMAKVSRKTPGKTVEIEFGRRREIQVDDKNEPGEYRIEGKTYEG